MYYSRYLQPKESASLSYGLSPNASNEECIGIKAYYEKIDGSFWSKYLLLQQQFIEYQDEIESILENKLN